MSACYPLQVVRQLVERGAFRITHSSRSGARALGLDERDIVACVQGLTERDFHKSMPALRFPDRRQDVYRPTFEGNPLYVKIQIVAANRGDAVVVISFKER